MYKVLTYKKLVYLLNLQINFGPQACIGIFVVFLQNLT